MLIFVVGMWFELEWIFINETTVNQTLNYERLCAYYYFTFHSARSTLWLVLFQIGEQQSNKTDWYYRTLFKSRRFVVCIWCVCGPILPPPPALVDDSTEWTKKWDRNTSISHSSWIVGSILLGYDAENIWSSNRINIFLSLFLPLWASAFEMHGREKNTQKISSLNDQHT